VLGLAALVAAALAGAAAIGFVVFRGTDTDPVPWATLGTEDVHALAFAGDDADHIFFGHHDGLLESRDGGRTWVPTALQGSDAMQVSTASGTRIQIAGHEVYMESTDGGVTWQPVPNDLPGLDLHAFTSDPADADHAWAFAVEFGLFETRDAGRSWESIQPGNWGALTAYRDGDITVLVAISPDGFASSRDSGSRWTLIGYPGPLTGGLAASADGSMLYAATVNGLRRSTDHGATWENTTFEGIALSVAVGPKAPTDVIVVDTDTRFYRSPDGGATWPGPTTATP
jgi:photosystem II stability/assembly factor-like uncharacterized protein